MFCSTSNTRPFSVITANIWLYVFLQNFLHYQKNYYYFSFRSV